MDPLWIKKMQCCLVMLLLLLLVTVAKAAGQVDGHIFTQVLEELARESLGVDEIQNYLNNEVEYKNVALSKGEEIVTKITDDMGQLFKRLDDAVGEIRKKVEEVLSSDDTFTWAERGGEEYERCLELSEDSLGLSENPQFPQLPVNMDKMCVIGPGLENDQTLYPRKDKILNVMKTNMNAFPELKWQYIGLEEQNYLINYPATPMDLKGYEPRERSWYKESASLALKDVVLVFDKSNSMRKAIEDNKIRNVLHTVINILGPKDRIVVIAFDGEVLTHSGCYSDKLALSVPVNTDVLETFVDTVRTGGDTSGESLYSKAFQKAFQYFINSPTDELRDKAILFIADGEATDTEEEILNVISEENAKLGNAVKIDTFSIGAIGEDQERLMTNIAEQITAKDDAGKVAPGEYHAIEDSISVDDLRELMAASYNRPAPQGTRAVLSGPYHDYFGFGIVYSACLPLHRDGTFIGVTCIDLLMRDLVEDLTSFTCFQHVDVAYTFMLDAAGRYVYHPLLPLSLNKEEDPLYADFCMFERGESATLVRDSMIRGERNSTVLTTEYATPRGTTQKEGINSKQMNLSYFWGPISDADFSVCVVLDDTERFLKFSPARYPERVLYHRTDLTTNPPNKCNAFNRIVLKNNATVLLTESAFITPGRYHSLENMNSENVSHIERFLEVGTPTDMHVKEDIRDAVAVLYGKLQEIWSSKREQLEYMMARYVGTSEGLFMQMPGVRYPHPYDHTKRTWYVKTLHSKHGCAIVGPYKDVPSGMTIATLTKTLTVPGNQTLGVVALDFSLYHLYYHFKKAYPQCDSQEFVCTIMDDSGMVVLHRDFVDNPLGIPDDDSIERYIVKKEPGVARKLKELGVFSKHKCFNSKGDKRYQNFFKVELAARFNGSVDGGFFTLHEVPGTNIFIVIRDGFHTDYDGTACYCLSSWTCDPNIEDCPCPCHEEAEYDNCDNQLPRNSDVPLPCYPDFPSYPFEDLAQLESKKISRLPLCYTYDCSAQHTKLSCDGIFSCSWCNETSCKTQAECDIEDEATHTVSTPSEAAPVGREEEGGVPQEVLLGGVVAGGVVLIVLLGVAVMCLRQRKAAHPPSEASGNTYLYPPSTTDPDYDYARVGDVSPLRDRLALDQHGLINPVIDHREGSYPSGSPGLHLPNSYVPHELEYRKPPCHDLASSDEQPCPVHGPSVKMKPCTVHDTHLSTEHSHRPLPPPPDSSNPPNQVYRMIRESSIYNNRQPRDPPDYIDPQLLPPRPCSGIQNDPRTPEQNATRNQEELRQQNEIYDAQEDAPAGDDPGTVVSYYNCTEPRPPSTASSTDYGENPKFLNHDVVSEMVYADGEAECPSPTPTYVNADEAEAALQHKLDASESAEPMYAKVPRFENSDVVNEITGNNDAYVTTEELDDLVNDREPTYETERPIDEKHFYVNAWLDGDISKRLSAKLPEIENDKPPELETDDYVNADVNVDHSATDSQFSQDEVIFQNQ